MTPDTPVYANTPGSDADRATVVRRGRAWIPLFLALACLTLYLPGVGWGLPAVHSWSQDSIGGLRTLGAVRGWPDEWQGRYPPLHYLMLRVAYEPILRHWRSTGVFSIDARTGQAIFQPPHHERIGLLLLVSGCVSVAMGVAAVIGLWKTTWLASKDDLSAIMAAVCFLIGADFTYFAKLSNVDVPSLCWFAWSAYFYVRTLSACTVMNCALLGLFGSLAISTKDSLAGFYPGMAFSLVANEFLHLHGGSSFFLTLRKAVLRPQWLIGIVVFLIPYLWINGVFHNPDTYARRMNYWLDVRADTIHGRQMKYANSLSLLVATFHHAASAVGWPMLLGFVVSGAFLFFTRRGLFLALFIPCISYYVIVIERMDFVYARFLLPILWLLSIAVGCTSAFWLRRVRVSGVARAGVIAVVLLPSIAYAWAVNLEMLSDTRYAAEAWFVENAPPRSSVGASSKPQYLPRLAERGLETYVIPMTRASFEHPQPEFIVLTSHDYEEYTAEQAECMDELVAGRLGYKLVAVFRGRFLPRHRSLYGMAAWGTPELGKISPTLLILQRAEN